MSVTFEPLLPGDWKKGDYRMAASLKVEAGSIEALASKINAEINHFAEPGLGNVKAFGIRSNSGRQVAFDQYENGGYGPNLLVLFEDNACRRSEVMEVLAYFGLKPEHVYWFAPEMRDF